MTWATGVPLFYLLPHDLHFVFPGSQAEPQFSRSILLRENGMR